jgi:hypothetical protein
MRSHEVNKAKLPRQIEKRRKTPASETTSEWLTSFCECGRHGGKHDCLA